MSGPVDVPAEQGGAAPEPPVAEVVEARESEVGGMTVRRSLPKARRRTVGAWCFVDHFGPLAVEPDGGMDVGPHPHTGLSTVTYLLDGEVLHRDSLGTEQVIRPGQLNLMTAGDGVSHAEEPTGSYRGTMHGVQLWVAQPAGTRAGAAAFEHHTSLPQVALAGADATVLVGDLDGARSGARADTPLLGAALDVGRGGTVVPLTAAYEHLLVVLDGTVLLEDGRPVEVGRSAYLGLGRDELALSAPDGARVLLLGGEPVPEPVVMWWNFVGRSREEVAQARASWEAGDDRFGRVGSTRDRIPAPPL